MGIYTDAYKMVRLLEGYLDDKITWTRKDLVLYLVDWLPNIAKRLLMELIYHDSKKKKAVEEEEEEEEEVE